MPRRRASENLGRLVYVLFAILSVACQSPTSPEPKPDLKTDLKTDLTIVGQVIVAAPTLTPIADAVITVVDGPQAGSTAIPDSNGQYALAGLTGTAMRIQASSPGHEQQTYTVNPATTATLDFKLKPVRQLLTETVSGTISAHMSYACDYDGDGCREWSLPVHHSGELKASLIWSPSSADAVLQLLSPEILGPIGAVVPGGNPTGLWEIESTYQPGPPVERVLTFPVQPGSTYTVQVGARGGPLPVDFTLVFSRPN